jgi:hypothetical protein
MWVVTYDSPAGFGGMGRSLRTSETVAKRFAEDAAGDEVSDPDDRG